MKRKILLLPVILFQISLFAQHDQTSHAIDQLTKELHKVADYDRNKQANISALKRSLALAQKDDLARQYLLNEQLFNEYRVYQYDSAYHYANQLEAIASRLNDAVRLNNARIKLGFSMLSSGMYKETLDSLRIINIKLVPDSSKAEYYALMGRYYYDLGDYDADEFHSPGYINLGNNYLDSALQIWPEGSYEHMYFDGLKKLKLGESEAAKANFTGLLSRKNLTAHQVAVTASTLADLYIRAGDTSQAIPLLAQSVIADIQSNTKETSAAFVLATLLYKKADIANASLCINRAFEDAAFFGARQRKVQVSAILPLIEAQKFAIVDSQKTRLIWYAILVTVLLIMVIALAYIVFSQVKKLRSAQQALMEAHHKTQEINRQLSETNEKLNDANKIKEEYIGYFFNVNSEFFDKIERFKKLVDQKLADRKTDEIKFLVNSINLKKEKADLLRHFDRAFLKLFPNFIDEFNKLFEKENQVIPDEDELLNTDLRIFALARMGIHENEKIAHILQYSVNTINTYKTRIKNKSLVPNEEFEKKIMQIRTV